MGVNAVAVRDGIAVLKRGLLRCHEPKHEFLESWHKIEFIPPLGIEWEQQFSGVVYQDDAGWAMLMTREEPEFIAKRLAHLGASKIHAERPTLQEIFLQVA